MTDCSVTCHDCADGGVPKVWRYLCEDCAREKLDAHRLDTGHDPQLYVATEISIQIIQRDMAIARELMRGQSRWPGWR